MKSKRIGIITNSMRAPGAVKLLEAFGALGVVAEIVTYDQGDIANMVDEFDELIFRFGPLSVGKVEAISRLSRRYGARAGQMVAAFDKTASAELLIAHDVAMPLTRIAKRKDIRSLSEFPVVVKIARGNQGKGVYLVKARADVEAVLDENIGEKSFVIQQFIAESAGSDKRLFVIGNRVVAAMQRVNNSGDFRSNLHTGGSGEAYTPTASETQLALEATMALGLDFAGVDIIDSAKGPLVLEVNPSPGFAISKVTGVDVAVLVAQFYNTRR